MPNHRNHGKGRAVKDDVKNNNCAQVQEERRVRHDDNARTPAGKSKCCLPSGCMEGFIDNSDPRDAVKVLCNNENCDYGNWMHACCFEIWESSVLNYLRSCGRARSWSEKQRLQNLWTKKGYDLAYKACDCKCGRGHLRKDLDYVPKVVTEVKVKKKTKKRNEKPMPVMSNHSHTNNNHVHNGSLEHNNDNAVTKVLVDNENNNHIENAMDSVNTNNNLFTTSNVNTNINTNFANTNMLNANIANIAAMNANNGNVITDVSSSPPQSIVNNVNHKIPHSPPPLILQRMRASSFSSSSGSSPSTSADPESPTPMSPAITGTPKLNGFEFFCDGQQTAPFKHRSDMSAFCGLPRHKLNSYHIKMEDEEAHGNDETRLFVLTNLSSYKVTSIECVLCKIELPVFDSYPLIDGTFFLSPQPYSDGVIQLVTDNRIQYLNAVCMNCLEGWTDVRCYACKKKWEAHALQIGTMYSYDIFAAMPCCQKRLTCKACHRAVVDIKRGLPFYSEYSCCIECPYCKAKDTHFIRPLSETFNVKLTNSIWKC